MHCCFTKATGFATVYNMLLNSCLMAMLMTGTMSNRCKWRPCVPNEIRTFLQPDISPFFVFQTPDNSPFVRRFVQVRILINGELSGPAKLRTENCPPVQNSRTEKRPDGGFVRTPCPTTRAAFSTTDLHSDQTISAGVGGQGAIYIKHLTEKLKLR